MRNEERKEQDEDTFLGPAKEREDGGRSDDRATMKRERKKEKGKRGEKLRTGKWRKRNE